nr:hypothetical protein Iba_chr12cCG18330 [Ipomoea batatas]GMD68947.1 hypothetical protein Iba_chr12dCG14180 [Ipomoea batatas]GMD71003.1 hypothetical protein Iba_chr12eCG11780 [Ipomoea batatas]GMD72967.1 hypothetical protein Iba_chr12fCG13760 [Ipomoea batatas]
MNYSACICGRECGNLRYWCCCSRCRGNLLHRSTPQASLYFESTNPIFPRFWTC